MSWTHPLETALVRASVAVARRTSWQRSLRAGERLGDLAYGLGVRRTTAAANLLRAFPERSAPERDAILRSHYREMGRVWMEYARLPELVNAPPGEIVAEARGLEHIDAAARGGRGAILLTGHFGNFELVGAIVGQRHPVDFVVKPLSNRGVEAMIAETRARCGVGTIPLGAALRDAYRALRKGRMVAMLADQDAGRRGSFVPFFGRLASTPVGPARLALQAGAPIIMGFIRRRADGRHEVEIDPPVLAEEAAGGDAAVALTARHVAVLEDRVRRHPEMWFWLHRRWKTPPP